MPLLHAPSVVAPSLRRRAMLLVAAGVAAAAVLVLLALTILGWLAPDPAAAAIVSVCAVALVAWLGAQPARQRAAEALVAAAAPPSEAQAPLAEVAEGLPDPVLVIGGFERDDYAGRRVLFANLAARDLFRLQADRPLLVAAVRNPEVLEVVDLALFSGQQGEAAYEAGGAQDRYWRAVAKPLSPGAGGYRRALLVLRDETDARRNERMRADFLANASHELRTPLASLAGFIDTLRGHAKDDAKARDRFLEIMAAQAWRMARLIEDLMSLSRIELNEHIRPEGEVDLAFAVADVADALAPQVEDAGASIAFSPGPRGALTVDGDRDQIVQVVQNLIDNALKYAGKGGRVTIEAQGDLTVEQATALGNARASRLSLLTPDHAQARYAAVRVTDSGPGLKREHLPRLTERFYRVEGQKSGERLGTGLGLAIVKHIMNRHRGGLAVESAEGEGATFIVYFPMVRAAPPPAPAHPLANAAQGPAPAAAATKVS
jgi:two-component system phosphate regulon sensor histidine kinase PhoR